MDTVRTQAGQVVRLGWSGLYPLLCVIMLATAPSIFLGDGNRNLGLIAFMFISPVFLFIYLFRPTLSVDALLLLGFAFSIVCFPILYHESIRWSTILYSLMFCALFVSYDALIRGGYLEITILLKSLRYLILAYTAVLLIQQFCVLVGLPIFNLSNYDPNSPWKLNALSPEPSHSARIVGLLLVTYILGGRLAERFGEKIIVSRRQTVLMWMSFLWTMITMVSATSVFMIFIVVLAYVQKAGIRHYLIGLTTLAISLILLPDELSNRSIDVASAIFTLDYEAVLRADHSGGMRVAPMLVLLSNGEIFSASGLFGHGIDSVSLFMSDYIWGVQEGFSGGGLLSLWYEYGFISFSLFVLFTLKATDAIKAPVNFLIWIVIVLVGGVNTQMVWLAIILLYTLKVFAQQARLYERRSL